MNLLGAAVERLVCMCVCGCECECELVHACGEELGSFKVDEPTAGE